MHNIFLALGTNLGERMQNLAEAIQRLGSGIQVERVSPIYETKPWGVSDQPDFLNMALRGRTILPPLPLLRFVKQVERDMGRRTVVRFGPRLIDIDILLYDELTLRSPNLVIPHPRMAERAFVLAPLADLAPDLTHPALEGTIGDLLQKTDLTSVKRWEASAAPLSSALLSRPYSLYTPAHG